MKQIKDQIKYIAYHLGKEKKFVYRFYFSLLACHPPEKYKRECYGERNFKDSKRKKKP